MEIITSENFNEKIMESEGKLLLLFHGPSAEPSVIMHERLETLDIPTFVCDVEEYPDVGLIFSIRAVPTMFIMVNGDPVAWKAGSIAATQAQAWYEEF